jgi:choice-of-anchor B domain-containing protein
MLWNRRPSGRSVLLCVLAGAAASAMGHDEDWRKLADRLPRYEGPVWKQGDPLPRDTFDSDGVTLLSWIPINNFAGTSGTANDCWGYVSPSGREYAILGLECGFGFVEITNPSSPVILATINGPCSPWHDVKVIGEYAYGVSEGGAGVQVMDLRNIDSGQVTLVRNWQTNGHSNTHNIASNPDTGYIYLCGSNLGNGGLVALNTQPDPTRPALAGAWSTMYVHDAQVVSYTDGPFAGREIAFCASGFSGGLTQTGLRIVDVTDKNNMFTVSTLFYPSAGYSHQVWLTEDKQYLYLNDELDEDNGLVNVTTTRIIDVSDIANPTFVGTYTSGRPSIDHNLYVHDGFVYQANYRSGLRVFDAAFQTNPVPVAYFDTFPGDDSAAFNGAWSTYPFFPSGTVIISDIERGLFVVAVDAANRFRLDLAPVGELPKVVSPAGTQSVEISVSEVNVTADPASATMFVDAGGGFFGVPGTPTGTPGRFSFTFPSLSCDASVSYYFNVATTAGVEFTLPRGGADAAYSASVATGLDLAFADNFQTNQGWTVTGTATDGQWTRGVPVNGGRGDPSADADGSGQCYVTDNVAGNSDVDSGRTILTGPAFDLAAGGLIGYSYWLSDIAGGEFSPEDGLFVDLSTDNGSTWTRVRTYSAPVGGWQQETIDTRAEGLATSATMRLRFSAVDEGEGDVLEAGVDAVRIEAFACDVATCPADLNGDGVVDFGDVGAFVSLFAAQDLGADLNGDGVVDFGDVGAFVSAFAAGC